MRNYQQNPLKNHEECSHAGLESGERFFRFCSRDGVVEAECLNVHLGGGFNPSQSYIQWLFLVHIKMVAGSMYPPRR